MFLACLRVLVVLGEIHGQVAHAALLDCLQAVVRELHLGAELVAVHEQLFDGAAGALGRPVGHVQIDLLPIDVRLEVADHLIELRAGQLDAPIEWIVERHHPRQRHRRRPAVFAQAPRIHAVAQDTDCALRRPAVIQ